MKTPIYLLKDIVIPAGTKFETAPCKTERHGEGHVAHVIGLSKDTSGDLTYYIGEEGSDEREQLKELFSWVPPVEDSPKIDIYNIACELYSAYCDSVEWTAFNGDRLPNWLNFYEDPTKKKQSNAWLAAAKRAISLLQPQ